MKFDWVEYYDYAKSILDDKGSNECSCRVGISRFYYAAYHVAKNYATQKSITSYEGGGTHERLWKSLEQSDIKDAKLVASWGNTLKVLRTISDYNDGHSIDMRNLMIAFNCAKKILSLCQAID